MSYKMCNVCERLCLIPERHWSLVSYTGDFVCSKECVLKWLGEELPEDQRQTAVKRAVCLWENRGDQPVFRSDYERRFADFLSRHAVLWDYERYGFFVGGKKTYMPDFFLPQYGVFLETKGKWGPGQKKKMAMFRNQYPEAPLLVIHWLINKEFRACTGIL